MKYRIRKVTTNKYRIERNINFNWITCHYPDEYNKKGHIIDFKSMELANEFIYQYFPFIKL
jgi:hypothetical protein